MAIEHVPSFWDSLGGGVQRGLDFYEQERQRKLQEAQAEQQRQMQMYGVLSNLAQQGANVNPQINQHIAGMGIQGVEAPETNMQLRNRIEATPERPAVDVGAGPMMFGGQMMPFQIPASGRSQFTDDQLTRAGLQTRNQQVASQVEGQRLGIQQQAFAGQQVDPYLAQLSGIMDREGFDLDRNSQRFEELTNRAGHYVSQAVGQMGKPVTRENVDQVAQAAYANWLKEESGKVPPAMVTQASAYFATAARQRYLEDAKLALEQEEVGLRRAALNRQGSGGDGPIDLMQKFINLANVQTRYLRDKYGGKYDEFYNMMQGMSRLNPRQQNVLKQDARFSEYLQDYQALGQLNERISQFGNSIMGVGQTPATDSTGITTGLTPSGSAAPADATGTGLHPWFQGRAQDSRGRYEVTAKEAADIKKAGNWNDTQFYIKR